MLKMLKDIKYRIRIFKKIYKCNSNFGEKNIVKKIIFNLRGFTIDEYYIYNLKVNNYKEYISEFQRENTKKLNGEYNFIMDNKIIFEKTFRNHVQVPKSYFWINNFKLFPLDEVVGKDLFDLTKEQKKLIIKPVQGTGGGKGVFLMSHEKENEYLLSGRKMTRDEIEEKILGLKDYIVTEFIEQHEYSSTIFDKTVNTIRLITYKNPDTNNFEIPLAVHRFGCLDSYPVDNGNMGGLVSNIDIEKGVLGPAKSYSGEKFLDYHPDSKKAIKGATLPMWDEIKNHCLMVANQMPYIEFIAWDVVITKDYFTVLETNKSTSFELFQLNHGIKNSPIGKFYKTKGLI